MSHSTSISESIPPSGITRGQNHREKYKSASSPYGERTTSSWKGKMMDGNASTTLQDRFIAIFRAFMAIVLTIGLGIPVAGLQSFADQAYASDALEEDQGLQVSVVNNPKIDIAVAGKNTDTLALTENLTADAAEILKRDYDIDAGEVLSMNISTVETVQSESKVEASGAADILGTSGNTDKYWSASQWGYSSVSSLANKGTVSSVTEQSPSDTFEIAEVNGKSRVRTTVERDAYRVFKNEPGYFSNPTKAEYNATFGVQMVSSSAHGEGWFWFKLSEDNKNGWAVVFDNHGSGGCGLFLVNHYALYLVKMENGSFYCMTDPSTGSYYSAKLLLRHMTLLLNIKLKL